MIFLPQPYGFYSYILNRGSIDRSAKRLPTFDEITAGAGPSKLGIKKGEDEHYLDTDTEGVEGPTAIDDGDLDEDDFDEIVDRFESSYNFRFEEPCVLYLSNYIYH